MNNNFNGYQDQACLFALKQHLETIKKIINHAHVKWQICTSMFKFIFFSWDRKPLIIW